MLRGLHQVDYGGKRGVETHKIELYQVRMKQASKSEAQHALDVTVLCLDFKIHGSLSTSPT